MKHYDAILKKIAIFQKIAEQDLESLLQCLQVSFRSYQKGQAIMIAGDPADRVGIVLTGGVRIIRDDINGNSTILAKLNQGDLFGEAFACAEIDTLPVNVIATDPTEVMFMDYRRIIHVCPSSCIFHNRLVENMMQILAQKNIMLNQKIEVLSGRTMRDKIMAYLLTQASRTKSRRFEIPFNRQELADYLSVDRSALSAELGRMKRDGLIEFHKNQFELY